MYIKYNHPIFSFDSDINEVMSPLRIEGFNELCYIRLYHDGKMLDVSSNTDMLRYFFDTLPEDQYSKYYDNLSKLPEGFHLSVTNSSFICPTLRTLRLKFTNGQDALYFARHYANHIEIFQFFTTLSAQNIQEYFFSKVELLQKFSFYFHDKLNKPIMELKKHSIQLPSNPFDKQEDNATMNGPFSQIRRYYVDENVYLTRQEVRCLLGILQGKSNKVIANDLNVSIRTVHSHFLQAKAKVSSRSRSELAAFLQKMNITDAML